MSRDDVETSLRAWRPPAPLCRALVAAAGLIGAVVAPQMAAASQVPFNQAVTQYAPAGLHMEQAAPLSVTVGGSAVVFVPTATDGVYSGSASGVSVTVTFHWYAAAQALTWDIALANTSASASPAIVVTPLSLNLDADLAGSPKVVPCTKHYAGSADSSLPFLGGLRSFDTTSVAPTAISGSGTGATSSVLQVAMNTQSTTPAQSCDEQRPSNLAGLYTGLSWSAGWKTSAGWGSSSTGTPPFVVTASTDQATAAAPLTLAGQESIAYPTVNLGFVTGSTWNDISNAQVNYVRTVLQPKIPGQATASPTSYDSYFGVEGIPPLPFLRQQARQAAALGIKYFTIDAGWYQTDNSGDQFAGLGNSLTPSISQYPQGQDSLADFCRNYVPSLGMQCGLWLVPQVARISSSELLALVREWATLLSAGLTIDDALAISEKGIRSRTLAGAFAILRRRIRDGATFHSALTETALQPEDATVLIEAGERSGALAKVLEKLATELRERRLSQDGIATALLYPAALLVTTVVAIMVIVEVVAPNLAELFAGSEKMPTRITALLTVASVTRYALPVFIASLAAASAAFLLSGRTDGSRLSRDRLLLRFPFLGGILLSQDCARFASSASLMIGCGMTPSSALPLAVAAVRNRSLRQALVDAVTRSAQGSPLHEALARSGALPADLLALIGAGLRAGRLGEVLGHGGDIHAERARSRVTRFSALLTPAITIFAGLVVGGLAYLVMTAVLSLNEIALQ